MKSLYQQNKSHIKIDKVILAIGELSQDVFCLSFHSCILGSDWLRALAAESPISQNQANGERRQKEENISAHKGKFGNAPRVSPVSLPLTVG